MPLVAGTRQIGQRCWVAFRAGKRCRAKWGERFHSYHPWRKRCRKTFSEEWAKRLILPCLNIARRPIIYEANSENMFFSFVDRDSFTQRISSAHKKAQFQFVIECFRRGKFWISFAVACLTIGATHRCSRRNQR